MTLRRFLTLAKSSKTKAVVPRLREVTLKASVHISDDTLLEYQHDLRTNSTFFNIKLTLDPANSDISAFQQFIIVNGLCDEFMLELDYDSSIIESASEEEGREALLIEYAENVCNEKISREIDVAEKLLNADKTGFFKCIDEKAGELLDGEIDSESIENGKVPLFEKSSQVYLEWFSFIEPCIQSFVESADIDLDEFAIDNPFELIDLEKVKTLGSMFGEIYEGTRSWSTYLVQTRKYQVGSVRVCPSARISEEQIKKCLAHCAASFFVDIAGSPIGRKFQNSVSDLQQKYISLANQYFKLVESTRREQKIASAKQAYKFAKILADELGPDAERLKLALDQDLQFLAIYYDTLTDHIRSEIGILLEQHLRENYSEVDLDLSSSISLVEPGRWDFSKHSEMGATNSPDLLTLRVSQFVANYFSEHPWLTRLNIKKPDIDILAEYGTGINGSGANSAGEYVVAKNFFYGHLIPRNSELIININNESVKDSVSIEPAD